MKSFVENNLKSDRNGIKLKSKIKSELGLGNGFKKTHSKDKNNLNLKNSGIKPPKVANSSDRIFNDDAIYEEIERIKHLIIYESKI